MWRTYQRENKKQAHHKELPGSILHCKHLTNLPGAAPFPELRGKRILYSRNTTGSDICYSGVKILTSREATRISTHLPGLTIKTHTPYPTSLPGPSLSSNLRGRRVLYTKRTPGFYIHTTAQKRFPKYKTKHPKSLPGPNIRTRVGDPPLRNYIHHLPNT